MCFYMVWLTRQVTFPLLTCLLLVYLFVTTTSRTIYAAIALAVVAYLVAVAVVQATPNAVIQMLRTLPGGELVVEPDDGTLIGLAVVVAISLSMELLYDYYPAIEWLLLVFQLPFIGVFVGLRAVFETSPGTTGELALYAVSMPVTAVWMILLGAGLARIGRRLRSFVTDGSGSH